MSGERVFIFVLFTVSFFVAIDADRFVAESPLYLKAFAVYLLFSCLYHHLRLNRKQGTVTVDYGINYSLSFGLFAGPFGVFLFETAYRSLVFLYKKITKTDDPDEWVHTFYNIGSFVLQSSVAYYLYVYFTDTFQGIPFGFWMLMLLLTLISGILSDFFLTVVFYLLGEIKTKKEMINFLLQRNLVDVAKTSFSNGLLFLFLQEERWEILISLFILNYLVSHSFLVKSQHIQNKIERDKYEQMAYTDFLTGIFNRAYMDKKMMELNQTQEHIGIVVSDIDLFKRINDTFSHSVGDQVIQHFASTLKKHLHTDDILIRSGGEEFTVFLRNRDFAQCVDLIETIRKEVDKCWIEIQFKESVMSISYTASFGLYFFEVGEQDSMEQGYVHADQLLYQSKQQGRNRVSAVNELTNSNGR